jgi:hypothetical protein
VYVLIWYVYGMIMHIAALYNCVVARVYDRSASSVVVSSAVPSGFVAAFHVTEKFISADAYHNSTSGRLHEFCV